MKTFKGFSAMKMEVRELTKIPISILVIFMSLHDGKVLISVNKVCCKSTARLQSLILINDVIYYSESITVEHIRLCF